MTPALRKQLFERWKEIRDDLNFNEFILQFEALGKTKMPAVFWFAEMMQ